MELPFELYEDHKRLTKKCWKRRELICSDNDFNFHIYPRYIWSRHCELCNKKYETSRDRHMEHSNITGEFRNIVCCKCNSWKADYKRKNDVSPYITKVNKKSCKQGFLYVFRVYRNGKIVVSKSSVDLEFLKSERDKWINENPQWFT